MELNENLFEHESENVKEVTIQDKFKFLKEYPLYNGQYARPCKYYDLDLTPEQEEEFFKFLEDGGLMTFWDANEELSSDIYQEGRMGGHLVFNRDVVNPRDFEDFETYEDLLNYAIDEYRYDGEVEDWEVKEATEDTESKINTAYEELMSFDSRVDELINNLKLTLDNRLNHSEDEINEAIEGYGKERDVRLNDLIKQYNELKVKDSITESVTVCRIFDLEARRAGLIYGQDFINPAFFENTIIKLSNKKFKTDDVGSKELEEDVEKYKSVVVRDNASQAEWYFELNNNHELDGATIKGHAEYCIEGGNGFNVEKFQELIDCEDVTFKKSIEDLNEPVYLFNVKHFKESLEDSQEEFTFNVHYKNGKIEKKNIKATNYHDAVKEIMKDSEVDSIDDLKESFQEQKELQESVEPGPQAGLATIINTLIKDEWDAIQGYNDAIVSFETEGKSDLVQVLKDIVNEENLHVGQLETLLTALDPETAAIETGKVEASEQLTEAVDAKQAWLKEMAQGDWDVGHTFDPDDFHEFKKIAKESGFNVNEKDFEKYFEYLEDIRSEYYNSDMNESIKK